MHERATDVQCGMPITDSTHASLKENWGAAKEALAGIFPAAELPDEYPDDEPNEDGTSSLTEDIVSSSQTASEEAAQKVEDGEGTAEDVPSTVSPEYVELKLQDVANAVRR